MKKMFIIVICFFVAAGFLFIKQQNSVKPEERIIMINNKLYYGTSETGPMGDSGCVEGNILSSVEKNEIPTENGQSNFGYIGNPYTSDFGNGKIMVQTDNNWYWLVSE